MTERLTDEQLRNMQLERPRVRAMAAELLALRARVARPWSAPMSEHLTIIVGEFTISKLRSGQAVEFDNGVTILPASDLATTDALRARVARLEAALDDFVKWSGAYPTDIFIEPDYERAHALLQAGGMTLDALSAATLRLATKEMGDRARAALKGNGEV